MFSASLSLTAHRHEQIDDTDVVFNRLFPFIPLTLKSACLGVNIIHPVLLKIKHAKSQNCTLCSHSNDCVLGAVNICVDKAAVFDVKSIAI